MHLLLLRIVFIIAALLFVYYNGSARPNMALHSGVTDGVVTDSISAPQLHMTSFRHDCLLRLGEMCDECAADNGSAWMSSLIGRDLGNDYYVGITAGRAWRPLQNYGDCDNKLRVYNPTIGVMFKYSF